MEITRRRLLSALSAAGLLAVIPTVPVSAAEAAEDRARLIANTVAVFATSPSPTPAPRRPPSSPPWTRPRGRT